MAPRSPGWVGAAPKVLTLKHAFYDLAIYSARPHNRNHDEASSISLK